MLDEKRKKLVQFLLENNVLVEPDFLDKINSMSDADLSEEINKRLNKEEETTNNNVKIVLSYDKEDEKKIDIDDFINSFNQKYNTIKKLLQNRQGLQNVTSINRIVNKGDRGQVSLIGMVSDINHTKNKNIILTVEDPTGAINVLVNENKPDLFNVAKDIVLDEVIGISGTAGDRIVFANSIIFPDLPLMEAIKKSPNEGYALFISDTHFGSGVFLKEEFSKFVNWLNGRVGTDKQKELVKKIKYLFITGDTVDGIGIYPNQEQHLEEKDIRKQYELLADFLKQIPSHIKIITCPGDHDAMRISEPQPPLKKDYAKSVYELKNVYCVSNPAIVNIDSTPDFPGFDVLLYHGRSFIYYSENVESIRIAGGQKRADLIMRYLLQRRHLSPTYASTLFVPSSKKDNLVLEKVPDIFASGHLHRTTVSNYRNIILLGCSCWTPKTEDQEKRGLDPQPCRAVLMNLKTREIKILNFSKEDAQ